MPLLFDDSPFMVDNIFAPRRRYYSPQSRQYQAYLRRQHAREMQEENARRAHAEEMKREERQQMDRRKRAHNRESASKQNMGPTRHTSAKSGHGRHLSTMKQSHKAAIRQASNAAIKIQRFWRAQLQRRRERSASIITKNLCRYIAQKWAQKTVSKLRNINTISTDVDNLCSQYNHIFAEPVHDERGRVSYDILAYTDALEKQLLKLDGILAEGVDLVKTRRKALSNKIQNQLALIDDYKYHGDEMETTAHESDGESSEENSDEIDAMSLFMNPCMDMDE
eukprot:CFRG6950T1